VNRALTHPHSRSRQGCAGTLCRHRQQGSVRPHLCTEMSSGGLRRNSIMCTSRTPGLVSLLLPALGYHKKRSTPILGFCLAKIFSAAVRMCLVCFAAGMQRLGSSIEWLSRSRAHEYLRHLRQIRNATTSMQPQPLNSREHICQSRVIPGSCGGCLTALIYRERR
jgi:hypothetical protein